MRARAAGLALLLLLSLLVAAAGAPAETDVDAGFAPVLPGYRLEFPRDYGSHPQFRIEWWYVTGWLTTAQHERLGFQLTFFRSRTALPDDNPSEFSPGQILIAHCAISDPAHRGLWHDQRVRRAGLGLAQAQQSDTRVFIDDWQLQRQDGSYRALLRAQDFTLDLSLAPTQSPLLEGTGGFSQKAPAVHAASYYYSEPHLRVSGQIARGSRSDAVTGEAWLDHEWSSDYLDPVATGWDWIGLNLDDGGAVMAFRIRDRQGQSYWSGGTVRDAQGRVQNLGSEAVSFTPLRQWRSAHTGVSYPVSALVRVGGREFELEPLLDDQENDARASSGTLYWEGAVTALEHQRRVGLGYLELTGYDQPLKLH